MSLSSKNTDILCENMQLYFMTQIITMEKHFDEHTESIYMYLAVEHEHSTNTTPKKTVHIQTQPSKLYFNL